MSGRGKFKAPVSTVALAMFAIFMVAEVSRWSEMRPWIVILLVLSLLAMPMRKVQARWAVKRSPKMDMDGDPAICAANAAIFCGNDLIRLKPTDPGLVKAIVARTSEAETVIKQRKSDMARIEKLEARVAAVSEVNKAASDPAEKLVAMPTGPCG